MSDFAVHRYKRSSGLARGFSTATCRRGLSGTRRPPGRGASSGLARGTGARPARGQAHRAPDRRRVLWVGDVRLAGDRLDAGPERRYPLRGARLPRGWIADCDCGLGPARAGAVHHGGAVDDLPGLRPVGGRGGHRPRPVGAPRFADGSRRGVRPEPARSARGARHLPLLRLPPDRRRNRAPSAP
jgi:hypothetical protein